MTLLAAAANHSVLDRLAAVPSGVWLKFGAAVAALVLAVIILRKVANMNKVVLGVIVFLVLTFVGFSWIYERNEPGWATPVVEKLATFFPTKGAMNK